MITAVTLNAAVDKAYRIDGFSAGRLHRVQAMETGPGGKGNNVACIARALGAAVTATGFLAGFNGQFIADALDRRGIRHDFVWVAGESRVCMNITDTVSGTETEILEPGPAVQAKDEAAMLAKVAALAAQSRVVALSGSLPPGARPDLYRNLVDAARRAGALVILDTSGEALVRSFEASPCVLKPNAGELAGLVQATGMLGAADQAALDGLAAGASGWEAAAGAVWRAGEALVARGVGAVVASLGPFGAALVTEGGRWYAKPVPVRALNAVGAGDALVAGLSVGLDREGRSGESALLAGLRLGTACAASAVVQYGAGRVAPDDVAAWAPQVVVQAQ